MNMQIPLFFQAFVALNFVSLQVSAGEVPVPQCPKELNIKQDVNDGWEKIDSIKNLYMRGMYFTYGDYSDKQTGPLKATEEKKLSNGDVMIFFDSLRASQHDDYVYWVTCYYVDSQVQLTQKLPENITRCEIKLFKRNGTIRETVKCFDTPRKTK